MATPNVVVYALQVSTHTEAEVTTFLNIRRLIADCGGGPAVAKIAGVCRTAPYGWVRRRYVSSIVLEKIKQANPHLDLNQYFETADDQDQSGVRA